MDIDKIHSINELKYQLDEHTRILNLLKRPDVKTCNGSLFCISVGGHDMYDLGSHARTKIIKILTNYYSSEIKKISSVIERS